MFANKYIISLFAFFAVASSVYATPGFFEKSEDLLKTGNIVDKYIAFGYILGVFDSYQLHYPVTGHTAGDVVDKVTLFIRSNPRLWEEPAVYSIVLWMYEEKLITSEDLLKILPGPLIKKFLLEPPMPKNAPSPAPEPK